MSDMLTGAILLLGCAALLAGCAARPDVRNAGFERGAARPDDWTPPPQLKVNFATSPEAYRGRRGVMLENRDTTASWAELEQRVGPLREGDVYRLALWIKTRQSGGAGAYAATDLLRADGGGRLAWTETDRLTGDNDWTRVSGFVFIPPGVREIKVRLLLNGLGRAWFDDVRLEPLRRSAPLTRNEATVRLSKREVGGEFLGFGIEDDPFFFTQPNLRRGVNEEDAALRNRRIRILQPATVKMLLFWDAFNPSHDMQTLTLESELMRGLYRQLDVYQSLGASVLISDAHWGWKKEEFPYNARNVERGAALYFKILDHLIRERGYTCIRYAMISGEPDGFFIPAGGTFETYLRASRLLSERINGSPLAGRLTLVGADIAFDKLWFERTAKAADPAFGMYSFHKYLPPSQLPLIREHIDTLRPLARGKPLYLWEYGWSLPGDDVNHNKAIQLYEAGLWNAWTCIEALNRGLAGAQIWCLHSMYYSEEMLMEYGLWEFKDKGWALRPVYYSCGLFTRLARPGARPLRIAVAPESPAFNAAAVRDARGGLTLFLVNLAREPLRVRLKGLPAGNYRRYEYSRERIAALRTASDQEQIEALATGEINLKKQDAVTVGPESLCVLKCE